MNARIRNKENHDAIIELLPWYANSTLTDIEAQLVEQHLAECQQCRDELTDIENLHITIDQESVSVLAPRPDPIRFLNNLRSKPPKMIRKPRTAWITRVAATIALTLMGIVFVTFQLLTDNKTSSNEFETLTSLRDGAQLDYLLKVRFDRATNLEERLRIVDLIRGTIIFGPDQTATYHIKVTLPGESLVELENYIEQAKSYNGVSDVQAISLKIPETE